MSCGIYVITNKINNKKYVGKDSDIGNQIGKIVSLETREKISKANKGKKHKRLSKTLKGRKPSNNNKVARLKAVQGLKKNKNGTSDFVGICWDKDNGKWRAVGRYNNVIKNLGRYDDEIEAAQAYDLFAIEYYGSDAKINFPNKKQDYIELLQK